MSHKEIFLLDELFDFPAIKGITEDFILNNPGNIPVYGGKKTETPIGYVRDNLPQVKYFENCLAWNREGSVGYVFYHKHKFTTNDHHRPMILKEEYRDAINLEYIRIVIEKELLNLGLSWSKTASKEKLKELEIEIFIDLEKQNEIANKYKKFQKIKKKIEEYSEKLKNISVKILNNCKMITINLSDVTLFSLFIGKRILKQDLIKNNNKKLLVPIYSANVFKPFGYTNNTFIDDFSTPSLIWGIDGIFDWNYIPKNQPFYPTDHCGVLKVKNSNINPEYLLYALRSNKDDYGFNRTFRASLANIKEYVTVEIPIKENGEFDIDKQNEIVEKYKKIENLRIKTLKMLEELKYIEIDIES
ncbi:restriction endonuclease subunit S [Thermoanaerobacterium sp. RBIITD]|uniref:restriction endonuclease subunit S n=1 Tax=Thermoanaerobacterium sp. RBIITD TaxID=1550240 RepID=UPI000BB7AACF|nr:restriction endonuclease subunit S [Thermoanaerobacterium sp. RBIITD]SNX54225.1 Type I restriction modification DNA specificity domain-containing protein [Thermoanaerobacterium sp. RBIITD]